MRMIAVRSLLVVAVLLVGSVARAQSDGVPFIDGEWTGKIKGVYYDQTDVGSNDPKQRYKDRVDVVIDQEDLGDIDLDITFENGLPSVSGGVITSASLDGDVGNFHMSMTQTAIAPFIVASGKINRRGNRIIIKGVAASSDYTHEFVIKLKKTGN